MALKSTLQLKTALSVEQTNHQVLFTKRKLSSQACIISPKILARYMKRCVKGQENYPCPHHSETYWPTNLEIHRPAVTSRYLSRHYWTYLNIITFSSHHYESMALTKTTKLTGAIMEALQRQQTCLTTVPLYHQNLCNTKNIKIPLQIFKTETIDYSIQPYNTPFVKKKNLTRLSP